MIYVASDLHGEYELYLTLLDKLKLGAGDTLFLLGDYVDRGDAGDKILLDIMDRENVVPLIGNHDYTAAFLLSALNRGVAAEDMAKLRPILENWLGDGGDVTLEAFRRLSFEKRERIFAFVDKMPAYREITVGGVEYFLCHAGIKNYDEGRAIASYDRTDFIYGRTDYSKPLISGKTLVTGHTPTALIDPDSRGRIFKSDGHIAVDCGAVFGLGLGCICLDNMREYYVK